MNKDNLPKKLAVFPLSNFIIFPNTAVPLNIFEPRYIDMINDSMSSNKLIGMIQPKISSEENDITIPKLHEIGCMGKITEQTPCLRIFFATPEDQGLAEPWLILVLRLRRDRFCSERR